VSAGGKRAQVFDGPPEQVLAQVEEAGPERRAVGRRAHARGVVEAGQRPQEDRELEVGLRDAHRRAAHARAMEYGRPLDQLRRAWGAVPRAALGALGLQLEQVAAQRPLEARERRLRALGGTTQRRLPPARSRRSRVAPAPALQQSAESE